MAFKEALHVVSSNMVLKLIVPRWATGLNKQFRQTQLAFQELEVCLLVIRMLTIVIIGVDSNTWLK
jgi:hypothetical protein